MDHEEYEALPNRTYGKYGAKTKKIWRVEFEIEKWAENKLNTLLGFMLSPDSYKIDTLIGLNGWGELVGITKDSNEMEDLALHTIKVLEAKGYSVSEDRGIIWNTNQSQNNRKKQDSFRPPIKDALVFSGAGISASSGIKTFEEIPELRNILDLDYFIFNYEEFWKELKSLKEAICNAEPTRAHKAIASADLDVITMNIDGLHQKAGSNNVLEVHGNLEQVVCTCCGTSFDFDIVKKTLFCPNDGSELKPNVVLYKESAPAYDEALKRLERYTSKTLVRGSGKDVIIVGTSFSTGFANTFHEIAAATCKMHIINDDADKELPELIQKLQRERGFEIGD